jgi:hypothetical protein
MSLLSSLCRLCSDDIVYGDRAESIDGDMRGLPCVWAPGKTAEGFLRYMTARDLTDDILSPDPSCREGTSHRNRDHISLGLPSLAAYKNDPSLVVWVSKTCHVRAS